MTQICASIFSVCVCLIIVKDEAGNVYWPMFGLNSLSLTKGKGYQVKMESDATLEIIIILFLMTLILI